MSSHVDSRRYGHGVFHGTTDGERFTGVEDGGVTVTAAFPRCSALVARIENRRSETILTPQQYVTRVT